MAPLQLNIPTVLLDGFYPDPQAVRDFALSLPFSKAPQTNYPGERSGNLQTVAPDIFAYFEQQFIELFRVVNPSGKWQFNTQFQKIPSYADPRMNEGWVHADVGQLVAGVIYLNPDPEPAAGTALCRPKDPNHPPHPNRHLRYRNDFYGGRNGVTAEAYIRARDVHNSGWDPYLNVENCFNRLVAYQATIPHKQNGFGWDDVPRLTQVFFATIAKE